MKKTLPTLVRVRAYRRSAGSALVIVLSFVVLLTVVVLVMLSHSLFSGLISNASSNVSKADIYGHGAINQIIGDLRQEIVAGSAVAPVTPATGGPASIVSPYQIPGTVNFIYRPSSPAASVPYNSGPYTTSVWNTTFPNLVKESTRSVAFYPATYDANAPTRAAAVNSYNDASRNGRYISPTRWNKPLLLLKKSATISGGTGGTATTISDSGTDATPVSTFVAPDWILTPADGSVGPTTTLDTSSSTTSSNINPKSPKYIVGRYAYAIYNEGGLLDANVAGSPGGSNDGLTAAQLTTLSRKGPSAFADLTQLPGIADLATVEGSAARPQKIVDTLIGWRNAATTHATYPTYPNYAFNTTTSGNYLSYLLGLSSNFMSTGHTAVYPDPTTNQNVTDQAFSGRQQMISFFQNIIAKNSIEKAYLQDAMMYLGTFSRTLNQPSYWPDPTRPTVLAASNTSGSPTYGNSAYQADNTANPPFKSIAVGTSFTRNDGTSAVVGEPLVKKRFALSRLAWLTCDGPIATDAGTLNTSDSNINSIVNFLEGSTGSGQGMTASFLQEGGPTNIHKYFGLTWVAGPAGQGSPGGYWYYDHGSQIGGGTVVATLSQVAAANREPDFFELLLAGTNVGGIAKVIGPSLIGSSTFTSILDSTVSAQILQLGANIIDEANPTQYPTHIVYLFDATTSPITYKSAYGVMDLPYLSAINNVRFIAQKSNNATGSETPTGVITAITPNLSGGLYGPDSGTGVFLYVPSIWNPCDVNGPMPITTGGKTGAAGAAASGLVAPANLRIVVSSVVNDLNSQLGPPAGGPGSTGNQNSNWPGPAAGEWTSSLGLGTYPVTIVPSDLWVGSTPNVPSSSTTTTVTIGGTTVTTTNNSECEGSYTSNWTSENSTALNFSNVSTLYREPTPLMQKGVPANSNLAPDNGNAIVAAGFTTTGILEPSSGKSFIGWLVSTFPVVWTKPSLQTPPAIPPYYAYSVNCLPNSVKSDTGTFLSSLPSSGETVRLEYQAGGSSGPWIPYMEYSGGTTLSNGNGQLFQQSNDFMPMVETGATGTSGTGGTAANPATTGPSELTPSGGSTGNTTTGGLWNNNANASGPSGSKLAPGHVALWDVRTQTWGFPHDVGPAQLFLDSSQTTIESTMPSTTSQHAANSHSSGVNMALWGMYEPNGGVLLGTKQQNFFGNGSTSTPNTDFYMDPDGTVRRAVGAYVGPTSGTTGDVSNSTSNNWNWTSNTTVGLPLATGQNQSRPIILHRPYRSVAELGYVFSNTPYKNIDFFTPESPYSALLDIFCINEDYRPDAVAAGRVDLNTKQAPVLQALLYGTCRDEENTTTGYLLNSAEAVAISQALVKRTTVGGTNPSVTLATPQPLSNIGDIVGRWITNNPVGTTSTPINGAAAYDGFSADLGIYSSSASGYAAVSQASPLPSGNYNIIKRFRETSMRAFSDAGQAGTWNLLIDIVAQSGRYPNGASRLSDFLVEGERRYWVHVAIDRSTGQVIDENIEPVNE